MTSSIPLPDLPAWDVGTPDDGYFAFSEEALRAYAEKAISEAMPKYQRDAADAERYRLAARYCILVLIGDAALGREEWDRKLDKFSKAKGAK